MLRLSPRGALGEVVEASRRGQSWEGLWVMGGVPSEALTGPQRPLVLLCSLAVTQAVLPYHGPLDAHQGPEAVSLPDLGLEPLKSEPE